MKRNGFTLIELLAVIAILAILIIMAVPAVIKLFNKSRIDTFNNELNTIIKAAQHQYILDGEATTYSNSSNPLRVTGNSDFNYCITVNADGDIIDFQATNGSYKYESDGVIEETSSSDITEINGSFTLQCSPIKYVNRQNEGSITVGDEVAIGSENFYVISSDSTETKLFAKYNLYVGDVFEKINETWVKTKSLSSSDTGYGLQNENAKASNSTDPNRRIGTVAFSGKGYWDNANCVFDSTSGLTCPGTSGLISEYGSYRSNPKPYVYRSSMSTVAPVYDYSVDSPWGVAVDNGYTIAYYIEGYVNTLKQLGAPSSITGELLNVGTNVSESIRGTGSYWRGNAGDQEIIQSILRGGGSVPNFYDNSNWGVRPVIVVPTNSMPH